MQPARVALPLVTQRLLLRDFVDDDWRAVHAYACRDEVVRYVPWGPNTEQDSRAHVTRAMAAAAEVPRSTWELAVVERHGDGLVGGIGLTVKPRHRSGFLGYCLHSRVWRRGYATEAARAVLQLGFESFGLHRIWTTCDVDNGASSRVLEKVGMRREGTLRHNLRVRGTWRDHHLYAVLASDPPRI